MPASTTATTWRYEYSAGGEATANVYAGIQSSSSTGASGSKYSTDQGKPEMLRYVLPRKTEFDESEAEFDYDVEEIEVQVNT